MRVTAWLGGALALALLGTIPAFAQKSADTLRVTWRDAIPDVDPYYNPLRAGLIVAHHAWDFLIYRDPETLQMKPLLATAWRTVDPTTLEFDLRHGVTFQNGDPFSADDVVYTINTIISDKQVSVPSNFSFFAGAEKIDDYKVRIKLKQSFPAAYEYLAMVVPIWPKAYRERIGVDAYAKAPIGAGPYKITRVDGTTEIDMERYDGYYADSPKGKPPIRRIVIHEVADATTEQNELVGGRADWIWAVAPDVFEKLAHLPNIQTTSAGEHARRLSQHRRGRTNGGG